MLSKHLNSKNVLIACIAIGALLSLLRFDIMQVGGSVDDAQYVVLAESLATGQGYRLINYPEPSTEVSFPPGWPLLLTPLVAFFPENYTALKLLSFLLWLATISLAYRLFSSRLESPYLELLTLLVATNALLVAASTMLMAEAAYVFFSLLTLNLFDYWDKRYQRAINWLIPAVAFAAVYTQLIRSVGLAIILAILVFLVLKRSWRQVGVMGACIFIGLLPQILLFSGRGGGLLSDHYQSLTVGSFSIADNIIQAWEQAIGYANLWIADAIIPIFRPSLISALQGAGVGFLIPLLNLLILFPIVVGFLISLRRFRLWEIYVVIYFGAILVFRDPTMGVVQPRFLIPLIPFFYFYLIEGGRWLLGYLPYFDARRMQYAVVTAVLFIMLLSLADNTHSWLNPTRERTTNLAIGTAWVRQEAATDAVLMTRDPIPRYLYARRTTVAFPQSDQDLETYLRDMNVNYILVAPFLQTPTDYRLDQYTRSHLMPYLLDNPDNFRVVFTDPDHNVRIFEVKQNE